MFKNKKVKVVILLVIVLVVAVLYTTFYKKSSSIPTAPPAPVPTPAVEKNTSLPVEESAVKNVSPAAAPPLPLSTGVNPPPPLAKKGGRETVPVAGVGTNIKR